MGWRTLTLGVLATVWAASAACMFQSPRVSRYILSPEPLAPSSSPAPFSVGVESLSPSRTYAQERIAFRDTAYELGFYHYAWWAVAPDLMLTEAVLDLLEGSGRFERAGPVPAQERYDYLVTGRLREIYEDGRSEPRSAVLSIAWEIRDGKTGSSLMRETLTETRPMANHGQEALAKAMGEAVRGMVERLIEMIFEAHAVQPGPQG